MKSLSTKFPASLALAATLVLVGCGDEATTVVYDRPADVAGPYVVDWTLQVLRRSDGFQTQFTCRGQMTLRQGAPTAGVASLTGFAVVAPPCDPESYDLTGTLTSSGAVEFTTGGPSPTAGPCPGGRNVRFSGLFRSSGSSMTLSARGVTEVTCPDFGVHEFSYLVSARR